MTIQPVTGILIGLVLILTLVTMGVWQYCSKGAWRHYAAGKAFMGLLGVQVAILSLATASSLFSEWPGRPWMYIIVYLLLIGAQLRIAYTIWAANRTPPDE